MVRACHTIIWTGQDYREQFKEEDEEADKGKRWEDNIKEWTGLEEWRKLVVKSTLVPQRSTRLRDR